MVNKPLDKETKSSKTFSASLLPNNEVKSAVLQINTHKGNGKINGSYIIKSDGINHSSKHYTRKGICEDIKTNLLLSCKAQLLLNDKNNNEVNESLQEFASESISPSEGNSNDSSIYNMEKYVVQFYKELVDELPIKLIQERLLDITSSIEQTKDKGYERLLK